MDDLTELFTSPSRDFPTLSGTAAGTLPGVDCLSRLSDPKVRFVNRDPASGTRLLFEQLLTQHRRELVTRRPALWTRVSIGQKLPLPESSLSTDTPPIGANG